MTPSFDTTRPRRSASVLDVLRSRIDADAFDVVVFGLETVAVDLGYGDVRPLPGAVAWIDELHRQGKRTAVVSSGERVEDALEIAGIRDRFDAVLGGPQAEALAGVLTALDAPAARALVVDHDPSDIQSAREAGATLVIAVARDHDGAERLRRSGAIAVVADLHELLGLIR